MTNRASALLWEEPDAPPAKPVLTRARIVKTALDLADAEGLSAVSIRRVASELGCQPMSLYSHIAAKDDLVALMLNEVSGELIVPEPLPDDWREALRMIAHRAFDTYLAHPWTLHAIGQGTRVGPNLLRRAEQLATVITRLELAPDEGWTIAGIVHEWAMGHALHIVKLREGRQLEQQLQNVDAQEFPALARILNRTPQETRETAFARALDIVLAGIETHLKTTTKT